jgi:hypothetical protein
LVSWSRDATAALASALRALAWNRDGHTSTLPMVLPRLAGRPIVVYPSRLPGVTDDFLGPARAVLVMHDLGNKPVTGESQIRSIFKLTEREASLAELIGSAETLGAAADKLAISYETARSMLKTIFCRRPIRTGRRSSCRCSRGWLRCRHTASPDDSLLAL